MTEHKDGKPALDEREAWLRGLTGQVTGDAASSDAEIEGRRLRAALLEREREDTTRPSPERVAAFLSELGVADTPARPAGGQPLSRSGSGDPSRRANTRRHAWTAGLALAASVSLAVLLLPRESPPPDVANDGLIDKSIALPQVVRDSSPDAFAARLRDALGTGVLRWQIERAPDGGLLLDAKLTDDAAARNALEAQGLVWPRNGELRVRIRP